LSYLNGIGSPQQIFDAADAAALANTGGAAKTVKSLAPESAAAQDILSRASAFDRASLSANAVLLAQALSGSDVRTTGLRPCNSRSPRDVQRLFAGCG